MKDTKNNISPQGEGLSAKLRNPFAGIRLDKGPTVLLGVILAIILVFWFLLRDTAFMSLGNIMNIVRQTSTISVMAALTVFVISTGEMDLSFASVPPLGGYVAALALRAGYPIILSVALALAAGMAIGLINGLITVKVKIPSFIVTLGMVSVVEGLARVITGRLAVPIINDKFTFIFGSGNVGPIPVLFIWTAGVGIICHVVLHHTAFGKAVLATGGNPEAAKFSGINTDRIKLLVLMISGLAGALGGLLYSGYLHNARYDLGAGEMITILAAVIIGGTALSGGKGSVIGAIGGSFLMGLINNGLVLLGLDTPQQLMFRGVIIVTAVALSSKANSG